MLQLDRWWLDPGPASVIQIPIEWGGINLATEGIVDRAHQHGQAVQYWTINDKETMDLLIEIGADGIMTNNPSLLRQSISEAGFELPEPWS
jgi:glycerophosphoryl diester phosphodiesterase